MSRRRGLLCSLPILVATVLAVTGPARGAETAPTDPAALEDEQTWTFLWSDMGMTGDPPTRTSATGGITHFRRVNTPPPKAPSIIAAPLPPALLPGLIGLAGVYAYKRRARR